MNVSIFFKSICGLCFALSLSNCSSQNDPKKLKGKDTEMYDFRSPKVINLPQVLDEISGIAYYPKDTSVFAIIDEDGLLFKIPLKDPNNIKQWAFGKSRDFEDVILKDSTFYVLVSNGDIQKLRFEGDRIIVDEINFPNASKKSNEFESLYFDEATQRIVIMCKQCEDDRKKQITSYFIDSAGAFETFGVMLTDPILQKLNKGKERIKPSAAAINPVTKDLYILCSVNKLLLITDSKGTLKDAIELDPKLYKQPEGITFTPQGDMIVSNEFLLEGYGQLLILKNKLKH